MESTFGEILSRHNAGQRVLSPACRNLTREGVQMRKVITLLLAAAMALSLVVITSASQTVYLKVSEAQSGNTVTYTFTLDAASSDGVGALEFYVETTGLTYQNAAYNTRLDNVFKPSTPGVTGGNYSFTNNNNQGHFVGYGGDAKTGRLLTGEVELISLTYMITDSANYKLTVKSGSFKACYSGERHMTDNRYICTVRTGDVMKGDVNGDGKVNATDVTMARQYYRGVLTLTPEQIARIDVKPDGKINATDITLLRQYYRGVITEFPN